jgi:hypothetical protein
MDIRSLTESLTPTDPLSLDDKEVGCFSRVCRACGDSQLCASILSA